MREDGVEIFPASGGEALFAQLLLNGLQVGAAVQHLF